MDFKITENLKTKENKYYVNNRKVTLSVYLHKIGECMKKDMNYNSSFVYSTRRTRYYHSSYN